MLFLQTTRFLRALSVLLCPLMLFACFGCRLLKNDSAPQPTGSSAAVSAAVPTPEPTEVPTPEPTQRPVTYDDLTGFWTLTGAMRDDLAVDIRGMRCTGCLVFSDDGAVLYCWDEPSHSQRILGTASLRDGAFTLLFTNGGQLSFAYDPTADVLLIRQNDDDVVITDYVYSRATDLAIPVIEPPLYESTNGVFGTWDLIYAEGTSRDGAQFAGMINALLKATDGYRYRYVFKETLDGFVYENGLGSETLCTLRFTANDGTMRITDAAVSLLAADTVAFSLDGDLLRLSDGDLTLSFLRAGGNLPL